MSGLAGVLVGPLLAENSLFHLVGEIFHPIFVAVATVLAAIYGVVPNYAVAIVLLTILIMALLTPLTVKSTKSMLAMQRIQPEITKLRQKYKGPENREQLNQELMRVYKEQGVNPAGSCLPMFLQMPFLIVLYDVIRGLANTVQRHGQTFAEPRYIPTSSRMHHDLVVSHGVMHSFGMNLALRPFDHHAMWYEYIPYFALVLVAVALQYVQMSQMSKRNPAAAQANPQMQKMQKFMPIVFAYIYFLIPSAVVIYMIVSTLIRIGTQDVLFRTGIVQLPGQRALPPGSKGSGGWAKRARGVISAKSAIVEEGPAALTNGSNGTNRSNGTKGTSGTNGAAAKPGSTGRGPTAEPTGPRKGAAGSVRPPSRSRTPAKGAGGGRSGTNGKGSQGGSGGTTEGTTTPKAHPRAKNKRTRKAR